MFTFDSLSDKNYQVIITVPDEKNAGLIAINGFVQAEFGFSGSNSWGNIMPLSNLSKLMGINSMLNPIMMAVGGSQVSLESLWQTSASWQGSQKPEFTIDLLFVATNRHLDPRVPVYHLLRGTFPSGELDQSNAAVKGYTSIINGITDIAANIVGVIGDGLDSVFGGKGNTGTTISNQIKSSKSTSLGQIAPYGFGLDMYKPKDNTTCTLSVGRWFRAPELVINSVNPMFSKEVTKDGFPLYARCSVTLAPYRMVTAEEVKQWFVGADMTGKDEHNKFIKKG
jgi:hypothetical protein